MRVTRESLQKLYTLTLVEAAKRLGLGVTAFKNMCRRLGIYRWPRALIRFRRDEQFRFSEEWVHAEPGFDIDGDEFWLNGNCYKYQHFHALPLPACE